MLEASEYTAVQNILNGNEYEFNLLLDRYKWLVYSIARKFIHNVCDIEDICQEVFLRIFKSLQKYNPEYKLSTWIAKITKNLCINMVNSQRVYTVSMDELGSYGFFLADDVNPEVVLTKRETLRCLQSEVDKLPEKYREPIMLYYFDGLSYNEIALKLNVPMTIVKNRIYRAKIMLRSKENVIRLTLA